MDLLILDGGTAGVSAALRARELGANVPLLESKRIGGTSINGGPAPVRTVAHAARLVRDAGPWSTFGLKGLRPEVDLETVIVNAVRVANYAHEQRHLGESVRARDRADRGRRSGTIARCPSRGPPRRAHLAGR